jgi:hypothetical protein
MSQWGFWDWIAYLTTWIAAIIIALGGAVRAEPYLRRRLPAFVRAPAWAFLPVALLMIGLVVFLVRLYSPAPGSFKPLMVNYGSSGRVIFKPGHPESMVGPLSSFMVVDGNRIADMVGNDFKLIGLCFHFYSGDRLDAKEISKSAIYDIKPELISIVIPWNDDFRAAVARGEMGSDYTLLALPPDVGASQFDTIRQAEAIGAKLLEERGGPP